MALEMGWWAIAWAFARRVVTRMLSNARIDITAEVISICVEALKSWGVTREAIKSIVDGAFYGGRQEALLKASEVDAGPASFNLPQGAAGGPQATGSPAADPNPSPVADRRNGAGPGRSGSGAGPSGVGSTES